jgi:hypothetical protein
MTSPNFSVALVVVNSAVRIFFHPAPQEFLAKGYFSTQNRSLSAVRRRDTFTMQTQDPVSTKSTYSAVEEATSGARIVAWRAPGGAIEVATMTGLITRQTIARVVARIALAERRDETVAAVTILTQALVLVSAEEMVAAELSQVQQGLLQNPRALIVPTINAKVFRRYGWMMAERGHVGRYVFTGDQTVRALQWAQEMGRHVLAERAWKSATHRQTPSGE